MEELQKKIVSLSRVPLSEPCRCQSADFFSQTHPIYC